MFCTRPLSVLVFRGKNIQLRSNSKFRANNVSHLNKFFSKIFWSFFTTTFSKNELRRSIRVTARTVHLLHNPRLGLYQPAASAAYWILLVIFYYLWSISLGFRNLRHTTSIWLLFHLLVARQALSKLNCTGTNLLILCGLLGSSFQRILGSQNLLELPQFTFWAKTLVLHCFIST